nr:DUF4407 domain-containing protein [Kibdelosporangium persicum]
MLDWVPEERPKYTRLGAIVLNTGLLAGISLLVALARLVDAPWVVILPAAMLWALLIITLDSWLVASTHGISSVSRVVKFLPRLVISVLIGAVIAEPLLLWVFQPAIHKEVQDFRQQELISYESALRNCNPPSGELVANPACAEMLVNIPNSPQAARDELATVVKNRDEHKAMVEGLTAQWEQKEKLARDECAGTSGQGLSGVVGNGPECRRNREIADKFKVDSQLTKHQEKLLALNSLVDDMTRKRADAEQTAAQQISTAIRTKVDEKRSHQNKIGILDEAAALGRLSDQSAFVFVAQWLVRLLLVAIDCMPVLAKLMSGSTKYDVLVSRQMDTANRLHDKHVTMRERQDAGDMDVQLHRFDHNQRTRIKNIDEEDRAARAKQAADLDAEIDALAAKLREQ